MKKVICLFVIAMLVSGCSPQGRAILFGPMSGSGYDNQQYQREKNYQQPNNNPQYNNPNLDCQVYPPGYSYPVRGGSVTYRNKDGSVTVCAPRGGTIYDKNGSKVGTYRPY